MLSGSSSAPASEPHRIRHATRATMAQFFVNGATFATWGILINDDRLISQGRAQRLAGLLQARYAFSRDEADAQVQSVLAKSRS